MARLLHAPVAHGQDRLDVVHTLPKTQRSPSLFILVVIGLIRVVVLHDPAATGCRVARCLLAKRSAMTGIEAVSNDVPAFEPPETRNAATTILWMSGILGTLRLKAALLFRPGTVVISVPCHLEQHPR